MASKKKDHLRLLLQQVELPVPSPDFTEEVMRETAFSQEESPVDVHLKAVLQEVRLTEPPPDFTHKVQKGLRDLAHQQEAKPIITRGAWIMVFSFLFACFAIAFYPSHGAGSESPTYFSWLADHVVHVTSSFREPILYFELIFISAGALLGLEKVLRNAIHWRTT